MTNFSKIEKAAKQWRDLDANERKELLVASSKNLMTINSTISHALLYQVEHGGDLVSQNTLMPGPTGETNELYYAGRGVCLLVVEQHEPNKADESSEANESIDNLKGVLSMLGSALVAGNGVVVCCDDQNINQTIEQACKETLPDNLVQIVGYDQVQSVIDSDIQIAALVGELDEQIKINRLLAKRQGMIVPLVTENPKRLMASYDPKLVLRFITERVRTINITAVGGNATLLELGADH